MSVAVTTPNSCVRVTATHTLWGVSTVTQALRHLQARRAESTPTAELPHMQIWEQPTERGVYSAGLQFNARADKVEVVESYDAVQTRQRTSWVCSTSVNTRTDSFNACSLIHLLKGRLCRLKPHDCDKTVTTAATNTTFKLMLRLRVQIFYTFSPACSHVEI